MGDGSEIKVPDYTMQFVQKLEDLLREHNYQLMGINEGDVHLYSKSGHMIGWWTGEITVRNFRR